ncbi:hypothetical protein LEMLEM_LOCUS13235 [Lemmus lemmus]
MLQNPHPSKETLFRKQYLEETADVAGTLRARVAASGIPLSPPSPQFPPGAHAAGSEAFRAFAFPFPPATSAPSRTQRRLCLKKGGPRGERRFRPGRSRDPTRPHGSPPPSSLPARLTAARTAPLPTDAHFQLRRAPPGMRENPVAPRSDRAPGQSAGRGREATPPPPLGLVPAGGGAGRSAAGRGGAWRGEPRRTEGKAAPGRR